MGETLLRQWTMLSLVPRAPAKLTAGDMAARLAADGFAVSKRTVERDLHALSAVFPLYCDDRNRPYGWQWARDAEELSIPAMSPAAALALRMTRDYLERVLPRSILEALDPHFRRAEAVLRESPEAVANWPEKVRIVSRGQRLIPPDIDSDVLALVYDALQSGVRLSVRYRPRHENEPRDYEVDPLGIVLRDGVITLVATLFDYDNPVQLHLHRMYAASPLETPASPPLGFDLDGWLATDPFGFRLGGRLRLHARMDEEIARHLDETPLSPDQWLGPGDNGWRELIAEVEDTAQLRWWLLGFGPGVEVLGPPHLRDDLAGRLAAALAH
ncbi:MAG: WYL domain-containing protein [Arhodomonas sp.]|nr:WYL domain-containing protein [Arhodomonas sp.]